MDKTKKVFLGIGVLAAIAVITFAFAIAASGSDGGVIEQNAEGVTVAASEVTASINYQGRLADSADELLSGTYTMTFGLYDVSTGGTALATDMHDVDVTDGLFNTGIDFDQSYFDGRELWLGVMVGTDSEMTPRQELRPVPYALSLVPGAKIIGAAQWNLNVETTHPSGGALRGQASATSGTNYGVVGASRSPDGYGGYFYNDEGGVGVYGKSDSSFAGYFDGTVYVSDNVGIGTTSPGDKLDVNGDIRVRGSDIKDTGGTARVTLTDNGRLDLKEDGGSTSLSIATSGNVGIGTTAPGPSYKLTVDGGGSSYGIHVKNVGDTGIESEGYNYGVRASGRSRAVSATSDDGHAIHGTSTNGFAGYFEGKGYFSSNVGIGTTSPNGKLHVDASGNWAGIRVEGASSYPIYAEWGGSSAGAAILAKNTGTGGDAIQAFAKGTGRSAIYADTSRSDHKYGVYTADYMYAARYEGGGSDVAEYFPTPEDSEPGTVMVIDPAGGSKLRSSTNAYDTTVAGIVSTEPGVSLGTKEDGNDGEKLIAVAGRVPCKGDASYAAIKPGDLLTTSNTPGHAMKAQPVIIGGVEIYRPGTTIGKALEPLDSGTGVIEVLVTLQ
jgi:hypothetical protein